MQSCPIDSRLKGLFWPYKGLKVTPTPHTCPNDPKTWWACSKCFSKQLGSWGMVCWSVGTRLVPLDGSNHSNLTLPPLQYITMDAQFKMVKSNLGLWPSNHDKRASMGVALFWMGFGKLIWGQGPWVGGLGPRPESLGECLLNHKVPGET